MRMEKMNTELVPVEQLPDEHDESRDFHESFWWNSRRYYLEDFLRVHNNIWFPNGDDLYPDYIHGIDQYDWYNPIFIELVDDGNFVNVYEERLELEQD